MRTDTAQPVRLSDYRAPDYLIDTVNLDIRLNLNATHVRARLSIRPNPLGRPGAPLILNGDGLNATMALIDGGALDLDASVIGPDGFTIQEPPHKPFELTIDTIVDPSANTQLMGLYRSGSAYCTQCEAEGFRRITYFLDRPDVLSVYTTRIEAEKSEAPILLGNGNLVESGDVSASRHYAVWHDPHPKPCYLFALVGGNLGSIHDTFTTLSGRLVRLGIYVEHGKESRAAYAMDALKRCMRWDEEAFGREYDLDLFNIVAVSDFNMGAMENKGLNIFNDKYVLALPGTATDLDYAHIEGVIAHEYFHNWTGNRITCRDWFQLCLKEGLTVFRDQEFSSDQRSRPVKRIADIRTLRAAQFPEDSGPLAHNVRPETYLEINNFYTPTIYEKGAEVIRMLKTLIGADAFRRGMDLYFERCDGMAATVEDFIACFAESSGRDLTNFTRWYSQAGTPKLHVTSAYDASAKTFTLTLAQSSAPTPGQPDKHPLVIPVALGLVGASGDLPMTTRGPHDEGGASSQECASGVFELDKPSRRIVFHNVAERPAPSVLRGFSAPVKLDLDTSAEDLLTLAARDSDLFNRWQAIQTSATRHLIDCVSTIRSGGLPVVDLRFPEALGVMLDAFATDPALTAQALSLPAEADIAREIASDVDPAAVYLARLELRRSLGSQLQASLLNVYESLSTNAPYSPDAISAGKRALRNIALDLIAAGDAKIGAEIAMRQFESAHNMTDQFGALAVLSLIPGDQREKALDTFYRTHAADHLVVDKWFALQGLIPEEATIERVRSLMQHHAFTYANPNRLRSLIGSFTANLTQLHAADGRGYDLVATVVAELDSRNPQVAARLLGAFRTWRSMETGRRAHAEAALKRVASLQGLSADVRDIVDRSLA